MLSVAVCCCVRSLYHADITRGPVTLSCTIRLLADFPRSPAHAALAWKRPPARITNGLRGPPAALMGLVQPAALRLAQRQGAQALDLHLIQMEHELNSPAEPPKELSQLGGAYSLSFILQRALTLLDVYVETDGDGGRSTAIRGTLCSRRVRGRDRRRPFVYDPKSGQFDQSCSVSAELA